MRTDQPTAPRTSARGSLHLVLLVGVALASLVVMHGLTTSHAAMPSTGPSTHVMAHTESGGSAFGPAAGAHHGMADMAMSATNTAAVGIAALSEFVPSPADAMGGLGAMCLAVLTVLLLLAGARALRAFRTPWNRVRALTIPVWAVVLADPHPPDLARLSVLRT